MVNGCVFIRIELGKLKDVIAKVKEVPGVKEAFAVFGRFDLVAFIEAPSYEAALATAIEVSKIEGLRRTETTIEA